VRPLLPRLACVVFTLVVLAATGGAEAGVSPLWRQVGSSSASGNGVSQTPSPKAVFDGALAVGGDGRPVVAYTEYPDASAAQGVITVKRWTGAAWELLSGPAGVGQGYEPQVRISASGAIYVAWLKDDINGNTEIRLRVRTASTFNPLGGSDSPGGISGANAGIAAPFSLALSAAGNPIVAFLGLAQSGVVDVTETPAVIDGTAQVYVRRWTGSAWEFVGSDFTGGGASNAVSFVTAGGATILHDADSPSLAVDDADRPVVAFTYFTTIDGAPSGNTDIYVTRWSNATTTWTAVGPAVPSGESSAGVGGAGGVSNSDSGSFNPSLAAGAAGHLALAWEEEPATGEVPVWLRMWNGVTWVELAGSATGSGFTAAGTTNMLPSIAIDPSGRPVVAWQALTAPENPTEIFVLRWNGADTWEELGVDSASNAGISDAALDALAPVLALTPAGGTATAGVPTVAWLDVGATGSAQVFLRQLYTGATVPLTVTVNGDGTVTSNPIGIECPGTCDTEFPTGTSVTLLPHAGPTGAFGTWSGNCTGSAACTVAMSANRTVNATFVAGATLTVNVLSPGGRVSSSPAGLTNCADSCSANFAVDTTVTLTASAVPGGAFTGWGGFCAFRGTSPTCQVPLTTNQTVTANFTLKTFRLNVTVATPAGTSGQGAVGEIGGPTIACFGAGTCSTDIGQGTSVSLVATPQAGNRFLNWSGGPCNGQTTLTCRTFNMTANASITALFRASTGVQVLRAGNGAGTVTGAGFNCGVDCFESVFTGTSVSLTATPAIGSSFTGWSGDVCNGVTTGPCVFAAAGVSETVGATFQLKKQQLTVTSRPSGNVVNGVSLPGGATIDCGSGGAVCGGVFDYGTPVTLQATPNAGFAFVNWTGTACVGSTNATCAFALKANVSVTPNFRARTLVTIVKAGNGAGTVSGLGISCGADCSENEFDGKTVTLTAAPAVGSRFAGFSGACLSATSPCSFVPGGDSQTVTATFTLISYTVTVANRTNGAVADTNGLPDPVNCGAGGLDCQTTLNFGTPVVLRATPITGSRFVNWTGGVCNGSMNATCAFSVRAANVSVSPNFKDVTALTLNKIGAGTVVSTPAGISCGGACTTASFDFARGILVKLTPTTPVGWNFDGFTGDCSGATCSLNASAPTAVVNASFSIQHRRLTVTVVGDGTVGGPGGACGAGTCLQDFDYGTSVPLTPTAGPGQRFVGWSQDCVGAGACSPLMTANHSVTAKFTQFTLAVTKPGNSTGTITATGINCGADCAEVYPPGTVVTLTRSAPTTGRTFRWGDDCAFRGTNATCTLTMNANHSVSADYSLQRLGVTVIKNGPALGTVTGLGGAIDCGADCAEVVDYGTAVTLLATPSSSPAAEFVSWTGCATASTNDSCSFTMTANRTVMVTFRPLVTSLELKAVSTAPLAVSGVRQVSAVATFTDASQQDVTTQATWILTPLAPPGIVSVSTTGLVTGRAPGNTSVTASFRLHSADVPVTASLPVTVDALQAIQVACSPYGDVGGLTCLPSGVNFSVHCQALGTFLNAGSGIDITDQATWTTTNAAVARSTGLVAFNGPIRQSFRMVGPATGAGIAILKATESGKTSPATGTLGDPWVVQGVIPTVTDLQVTPSSGNVAVGGTLQLQATATVTSAVCTAPQPRDFSTAVTWASTAETVADVTFFGEVTGIAPGNATITASYGIGNPPPFSDSASITVP
jgi:Divergent InlB B-repeat domain/Bacterial Ig-like domain (group 2)